MDINNSSAKKTIGILLQLATKPYEYSALDLSSLLGITRSTVHRNLNELKAELLVLQNPLTKKYSLGPTAYHIGSAYLSTFSQMAQIRSLLARATENVGQTIGFSKLVGERVINLIQIETYQSIRIGRAEGSYYPINCGAYGKCIMAFFEPLQRLEELVRERPLKAYTKKTITNPDELLLEYSSIRKRGYAISDEELSEGLYGIGAPAFDSKGQIFGSVATAFIKGTVDSGTLKNLILEIKENAAEVSRYIV